MMAEMHVLVLFLFRVWGKLAISLKKTFVATKTVFQFNFLTMCTQKGSMF